MHLEIKEPLSNMKLRVLNIIIGLFIAACGITSCLDSDTVEYEFSSNASITAFSITDSIVTYYPAVVNGRDTTLSTGVVGTDYPFVINQHEGLIYNPDSLPFGTDVSKVVVDITADTEGIFIVAETDSLWEETDSLNFKNPIQFKVISQAGTFGRTYTAKINVHQIDPDSMSWTRIESNFASDIEGQKAVYANNHIYVFGEQNGQIIMTKANVSNATTWSAPVVLDIPGKIDYTSVMIWGNQFYILADNQLYISSDASNWQKQEVSHQISQLIANVHTSNNQKIIGVDVDNHYIESADGITWNQYETMPSEFPNSHISFASYALDTNSAFDKITLIGDNGVSTDTVTVAWTQLSSENEWIDLTPEYNNYGCPKFENISMIHYNNKLYAFGGDAQHKGSIDAFSKFYVSEDNGISWTAIKKKIMFPKDFNSLYNQAEGNYSCIVDDQNFIWIMWSHSNEVWRGRINKLGFDKK